MLPPTLMKDSCQGISYKGEKEYKSYKSGESIDKMLSSGNETDITCINSDIVYACTGSVEDWPVSSFKVTYTSL